MLKSVAKAIHCSQDDGQITLLRDGERDHQPEDPQLGDVSISIKLQLHISLDPESLISGN
jgi:hypothetical protein